VDKVVHVKEVPPAILIARLEEHIKKNVREVKPPEWSFYVKTGAGKKVPPENKDWWYTRAASLLRKIYLNQPIGISRIVSFYGCRKDYGLSPEHHVDGGGSNIRKILQQLEAGGLVEKSRRGRMLTPKGRALIDKLATELSHKSKMQPWYEMDVASLKEEKGEKGKDEQA
jgi:small subunit ribosomal protein S19e